jgi:hypothetical protein
VSYLDTILGGYKRIQSNGTQLPAETSLNFLNATITDDPSNNRTNVTVNASVAAGTSAQMYQTNAGPTAVWVTISGDAQVASGGAWTNVKINGASVPTAGGLTTGNVLQVSGVSALTYGPVNLAGGSNYVTGTLPVANITAGTAGQIFVTNSSPATAWTSLIKYETTHGRFTSGGGGTDALAVIGPLAGAETDAALYLLANGGTPSSTNYSLYSDGSTFLGMNAPSVSASFNIVAGGTNTIAQIKTVAGTQDSLWLGHAAAFGSGNVVLTSDASTFTNFNFPSGAYLGITTNNASYVYAITATTMYVGSSNSAAAPVIVDFTTSTAPTIRSGTSATTLGLGTNKSSATLNLQAGAALTAAQCTNPSASLVSHTTIGQRVGARVNKGANYTIDSSGSGDDEIWMTAACTITLPNPALNSGRKLEIVVNYDPAVGGGTIARNGSENINNAASNITLVTGDKFSILQVRCDGTNWIIKGGLSI